MAIEGQSKPDKELLLPLVKSALGSSRLEGLEPPEEALNLAKRYAEGQITSEEFDRAIEVLLSAGQVHISQLAGSEEPEKHKGS